MTPKEVDAVEAYFGPYLGTEPAFGPAMQLVAHVRELQQFVVELTEHDARPPGPEKTANHYAMQRRGQALREKIIPLPVTKRAQEAAQ